MIKHREEHAYFFSITHCMAARTAKSKHTEDRSQDATVR